MEKSVGSFEKGVQMIRKFYIPPRVSQENFFRKICILTVILGTCILFTVITEAESITSSEYAVKATFLYHFAKFTEWPAGSYESPEAPVVLCILGKNPFGENISVIKNKRIRGRPLLIRECQDITEGSHILFISSSEEKNLPRILSETKDMPCLTVSDMTEFVRIGGMVRFFRKGNKIRFEVNPKAAKRSHLKISSRLLKLALIFNEDDVKKGDLQ